MPIIVWAVALEMNGRRDRSDLMPSHVEAPKEVADLLIDPHAIRSELVYLAQDAELRQLGVGHAHVGLVTLDIILGDGLELGSGSSVEEAIEDGKGETLASPGDEAL